MSSDYEQLKERIEADNRKQEARQRILRQKRDERRDIRKGGGGINIAKQVLARSGDDPFAFNYGHNVGSTSSESIDERIEREQAERCMEKVYCSACKTYHGYCSEITEEKEKMKMLPTGQDSQSSKGQKRGSGIEWLKIEDLSTVAKEAKILAVNYNKNGRYGARVEMKLAIDGKIKYWGVPPNKDLDKSPNYKLLTEKFGHDENDWLDQRILLFVEPHRFYEGQYFIRVDFPTTSTNSGKKGK